MTARAHGSVLRSLRRRVAAAAPWTVPLPPPPTSCSAASARPLSGSRSSMALDAEWQYRPPMPRAALRALNALAKRLDRGNGQRLTHALAACLEDEMVRHPPGSVRAGTRFGRARARSGDLCRNGRRESGPRLLRRRSRYRGLDAVVAEVARLPMTPSRRLQLAAESSGAIGLALRRWRRQAEPADFGRRRRTSASRCCHPHPGQCRVLAAPAGLSN
jgi:hypothetical protein